jgi:hypothetical protein
MDRGGGGNYLCVKNHVKLGGFPSWDWDTTFIIFLCLLMKIHTFLCALFRYSVTEDRGQFF